MCLFVEKHSMIQLFSGDRTCINSLAFGFGAHDHVLTKVLLFGAGCNQRSGIGTCLNRSSDGSGGSRRCNIISYHRVEPRTIFICRATSPTEPDDNSSVSWLATAQFTL